MSIYLRSRLIQAARLYKESSKELVVMEREIAAADKAGDAATYIRLWFRAKRLLDFLATLSATNKHISPPIFMGLDHQKGDYLLPLLIQHNINAREKL